MQFYVGKVSPTQLICRAWHRIGLGQGIRQNLRHYRGPVCTLATCRWSVCVPSPHCGCSNLGRREYHFTINWSSWKIHLFSCRNLSGVEWFGEGQNTAEDYWTWGHFSKLSYRILNDFCCFLTLCMFTCSSFDAHQRHFKKQATGNSTGAQGGVLQLEHPKPSMYQKRHVYSCGWFQGSNVRR
jgi:hypothetical protein